MNMHLTETQINDLVDETLSRGELAAALEHVSVCANCRAEVEALRGLLQRVAQLPLAIEPKRDLRAGIWAQADRKTLWNWRYPLAAAAVMLIAMTAVLTLVLTRDRDDLVRTAQVIHPSTIDVVSLERRFGAEVEDLERALAENREALSPETVRIMETNLRVIDQAIQESRAALERDPNSAMLGELLRSAYQRKLDLLRQAARSSAAT